MPFLNFRFNSRGNVIGEEEIVQEGDCWGGISRGNVLHSMAARLEDDKRFQTKKRQSYNKSIACAAQIADTICGATFPVISRLHSSVWISSISTF